MKSLRDLVSRGRNLALATGLVAGLALGYQTVSAQEKDPISDNDLLTAMAKLGLNSQSESDREVAEFLYTLGLLNHDVEVAKAGSDRIIINVDGRREELGLPENVIYHDGKFSPAPGYMWVDPESPGLETERIDESKLVRATFTYNNARDRDGDRLIKEGEFDRKDIFVVGEEIKAVIQYETPRNIKGERLMARVFGADGKQVCGAERVNPDEHNYDTELDITGCNLPPGKYSVEWYVKEVAGEVLLVEHSFRVVEDPNSNK